jgi:hypothetical protein
MSHSRRTFWSVAIEHLRKGLGRYLERMGQSSGFYLAEPISFSSFQTYHFARIPTSNRVTKPRPSRSTLRRHHQVQLFGSSSEKRSCVVSDRAQDFLRRSNLPH